MVSTKRGCKVCGQSGHYATTCPKKAAASLAGASPEPPATLVALQRLASEDGPLDVDGWTKLARAAVVHFAEHAPHDAALLLGTIAKVRGLIVDKSVSLTKEVAEKVSAATGRPTRELEDQILAEAKRIEAARSTVALPVQTTEVEQ